jgi:hypothetical protein
MKTDGLGSRLRGVLTLCLVLIAAPCFAQHAGLRQQWQPQTESDPRLQQRVATELICISTRRGLPLLAEQTGVSLSVAPENLDTTGERKFMLIARGCTLKEVMVQLCEALRECHWDVDTSGVQPAYLLHRNAGVEAAERERQEEARAQAAAERREERIARVDLARRALAMTPEEVAELEKTDLLLARALRYPPMRDAMEAFFSLPPERVQELAEKGWLDLTYPELPERARQLLLAAVRAQIAWDIEYLDGEGAGPGAGEVKQQFEEFARGLPQSLEQAPIGVRYSGVSYGLTLFADPVTVIAIPARHPTPTNEIMRHLLEATGETREAAAQTAQQYWAQWQQQRREEEERRLRERVLAPEVERPLATPFERSLRLCALEKAAAEQTGLSVVADAFWSDQFEVQMNKPAHPGSVRQALDAAASWAVFEWWTTGRCLVLRAKDFDWYEHARRDVPESVVFHYRGRLRAQGRFTLDDALALAEEMGRRGGVTRRGLGLPADLCETGLWGLSDQDSAWAVALLRSLTPEERARAEGPEGLRLADLSQAQRDRVTQNVDERIGGVADAPGAVFRITKSEGTSEGRRYAHYRLRLRWGEGEGDEAEAGALLFDGGAGPEGATDEH